MRAKITKKLIKETDRSIKDLEVPKLELVVRDNSKRWYLRHWDRLTKNTRRTAIGCAYEISPNRARAMAREILESGSLDKKAIGRSKTIGQLWREYLREHSRENHSGHWQSVLETLWKEHLKKLEDHKIRDLSKDDIERFLKSKKKYSAEYSNKILRQLVAIYKLAEKKGYIEENPTKGIKRRKTESAGRILSSSEIAAFLAVFRASDHPVADAALLALYTGARRSNILSIHNKEINLKSEVWNIPSSKMKNRKKKSVFLSTQALSILCDFTGHRFKADSKSGHIESPRKKFQALLKLAGIKDFRFHDLRS